MPKWFNTAGRCFPDEHYMIDPVQRLAEVEELIEKKLYFTIHAPRQTGKTTYLHALAEKLNKGKKHIALVVSFEQANYSSLSVREANDILINNVYRAAMRRLPEDERPPNPQGKDIISLHNYLEDWVHEQKKLIVLLVDEIDALLDDVLIAVLRQFRDGYQDRPDHFPSSIVLVGLRDVRDYKARIRPDKQSLGSASPFNIKSDSLLLKNFSKKEVYDLLEQHTKETGQVFPRDVKDEIYRLSGGQPWLTNALANQVVSKILKNDYTQAITLEHVSQAKQQLILRRDTHLDSLADKLKEERVKKIVQAIINGSFISSDSLDDDISYVQDLGIAGQSSPLEFANPIYAEIIPRMMSVNFQASIPKDIQQPWFLDKQGNLEMDKLIEEFQKFYRRNSEAWLERYEFKESAHHLLLMAFLQRVINSGGEIIREMAAGNGRIDLLVKFKKQEFAFELKILRDSYTIEDGKEQLARYLDRLGLPHGYLVVFDKEKGDWDKKIYIKKITYQKKKITLVGC